MICRDYLLIEEDGRQLRMELARIGGKHAGPSSPPVWVLDEMAAMARVARVEASPGMSAAQLRDLQQITARFPSKFFLPRLVIALALNGHVEDASRELRRFRGIHGEAEYQDLRGMLSELAATRYPTLNALLVRTEADAASRAPDTGTALDQEGAQGC